MNTRHGILILAAFLLSVATMLAPEAARAMTVRGSIETADGILRLAVRDYAHPLQISATTPALKVALLRLREGDFLVARGSVDAVQNVVYIEAIESLGLRELIGAWASSKLEVYEFEDFSKLNLYVANAKRTGVIKTGQFNYAVAPDQGDSYSIFMSDDRSIAVGSLEFKNQRLKITILDPKTGRVSENISLSPLSVK